LHLELLTGLLSELECDDSLKERRRLQERLEVLDRLEAYVLPLSVAPSELSSVQTIHDRLEGIQRRLEAINAEVFAAIRRDVRDGYGRAALLSWLPHLGTSSTLERDGYDFLDDVIAGVLEFEEPEATSVQPTAEMVFYQPTPARHVFDLLKRAALTEDDVLVDIGSGLGHVPVLTSLWTSARSIGVELEPAYVACARRVVDSLNIKRVDFLEEDARVVDYSIGTVFYLYTPFTGTMMRTTLDLLRREANTREIRICTFGPCTPVIAAEDWLDPVGKMGTDRIAIFRSRSLRLENAPQATHCERVMQR
jgi:hypothetical protein